MRARATTALTSFAFCACALLACTDEVQLARTRAAPTTSPPSEVDAQRPDPGPVDRELTRADFCAGGGSPVARDQLAFDEEGEDACLQPAPQLFRYGLCTCADSVFGGGLLGDAFDSSLAPYAPGGIGGGVGVNGQVVSTGSVELFGALTVASASLPITIAPFHVGGTMRIAGDLTIAVADAAFGRDVWVTGEIVAVVGSATIAGDLYQPPGRTLLGNLQVSGASHAQPFEIAPPCPCEAQQLLDVAAIVERGAAQADNRALGVAADALTTAANGGALELECGRYAFEGGVLDELRIVARARTAIYVRGDLAITRSFEAELGDQGELDVFVDGVLGVAAGASVGSASRPGAVRFYVGGEGELALPGSVAWSAALYAPRTTLYVTPEQTTSGALFLAGYYASGRSILHYDSALLHPVHATTGSCGERTPRGGCTTDADCDPPFICQAATCSSRLL